MKRYIIVILCAVALLIAMAMPCLAYTAYPALDEDILGYSPITAEIIIDSSPNIYQRDTTPYTIYDTVMSDVYELQLIQTTDSRALRFIPANIQATRKIVLKDLVFNYEIFAEDTSRQSNIPVIVAENIIIKGEAYSIDGRYLGAYREDTLTQFNSNTLFESLRDAFGTVQLKLYIESIIATDTRGGDIWYQVIPVSGDTTLNDFPLLGFTSDDIIVSNVVEDVDIGEFLWGSVTNFLRFEILPNVSLYMVFIAIIAIPLLIWILKIFAGG